MTSSAFKSCVLWQIRGPGRQSFGYACSASDFGKPRQACAGGPAIRYVWRCERIIVDRADAVAFEDGLSSIVFDWKSDVTPDERSYRAHAGQLLDYLMATGLKRGTLVYVTRGFVKWVEAAV